MARAKTIKRSTRNARPHFKPQDLLHAGIGAVSVGSKQAASAYADGFEAALQLRRHAIKAARAYNQELSRLGNKARARTKPVRARLLSLAGGVQSQIKSTLAPVLARLGWTKPAAKRRAAAKKSVTRRTRSAA